MTIHFAFIPHDPGHGSTHLDRMHAWLVEQSEFIVHSGRQFGGAPT